jgi:predicted amidophosphoribosyltransferase
MCHGCGGNLPNKKRKWCDECRPTRAEYNKLYYERNGAKVRRRVNANSKVCSGCGAKMLKAARRCGFCEAENPLTRPVRS